MSLLTVRDVAHQVGLSEWAVRRAIHDGQLHAHKLRGRLRVHPDALAAWLDASSVEPTTLAPVRPLSTRRRRDVDLSDYELRA